MAGLLPPADGQEVLCRFGVNQATWALLETDKEEFRRVVKAYVALCMPHYEVVRASPKERTIYLRRKTGA